MKLKQLEKLPEITNVLNFRQNIMARVTHTALTSGCEPMHQNVQAILETRCFLSLAWKLERYLHFQKSTGSLSEVEPCLASNGGNYNACHRC